MREKAFTVKISDMITSTFRAGGPGGQNQNKRDTGVRLLHAPSGAVTESRSARTQLENKRLALGKMAHNKLFLSWCRRMALKFTPVEELVDAMMAPENLKVEVREKDRWVESNTLNS